MGAPWTTDKLVIATGADMRPDEVPGLAEHAATIWTPQSMLGVRERFERVRDAAKAGRRNRVLFLIPPNNKCAGPLYELVLMFETWLRRAGVREQVAITWSTFEQTYIQAFGPRLHDVVSAEFAERDIDGHTGESVTGITDGVARYADGGTREFDELIAFPPYVSAMTYEGLPSDDRGFLQTELTTRQVAGRPDIYAPGDGETSPSSKPFSRSCKRTRWPSTLRPPPASTSSSSHSIPSRCASWRCSTRPPSPRSRSS